MKLLRNTLVCNGAGLEAYLSDSRDPSSLGCLRPANSALSSLRSRQLPEEVPPCSGAVVACSPKL